MLRDAISATNLDEEFCAHLVGATPEQFQQWMSGERPVPRFLYPELTSIFGFTREDLSTPISVERAKHIAPAIWYKLQQENKCNSSDLKMIGMTRKLCFRMGQFRAIQREPGDAYKVAFKKARTSADQTSPAVDQGRAAAQSVRKQFGWDHGSTGIGELIRPNLRQWGLVVVESSFPEGRVEGCSFMTDGPESKMICLFANFYGISWFRRNAILLHELCHAIFDLINDPLSVDYLGEEDLQLKELRAQAFAQECLVPQTVLSHYTNQYGIDWHDLNSDALSRIIASTHAEQALVLKSALENNFIDPSEHERYKMLDGQAALPQFTTHGLSTNEYAKRAPIDEQRWLKADRYISFGKQKLLLPAGYLKQVIDALNGEKLTRAKAAELTLLDPDEFSSRFKQFITETS